MSALTVKEIKYTAEPTTPESRYYDFVDLSPAKSGIDLRENDSKSDSKSDSLIEFEPEYLLSKIADTPEILPHADKIVSSIKAVVFEVLDHTVRLKIGNEIMINIPRVVFDNKEEVLKYGQQIIYSIKMRANGFRYQDFEIDNTPFENPYKNRVLEALSRIKDER